MPDPLKGEESKRSNRAEARGSLSMVDQSKAGAYRGFKP
jgi:hypothetical protein